ncbi:MAG: HlyD family efflux transporter periplasmic adaptor subunit [Candidatus Uhrbacteria bacterium]
MKKIWQIIKQWKKTFIFLIILLIGGGIWFSQTVGGGAVETRYVLAAVEKGTLMTSVTGTGQVQGEAEIEVKPEASGKVIEVVGQNGQQVEEGDILVVLDSTEAAKSVRDARLSLASAEGSLQKLQQPTDTLSLLQAQNALAQAKRTLADLEDGPDDQEIRDAEETVTQAERNLDQTKRNLTEIQMTSEQDLLSASEEGYDAVTEAFTELSAVMDDLSDFLGTELNEQEYLGYYELLTGSSYTDGLIDYYEATQDSYDVAWVAYRASDHDSETATKIEVIGSTLVAGKDMANTLNDAQTILNKIQEEGYSHSAISAHIDDMIETIPGDITLVNNLVSSLQSADDTIESTDLNAPNNITDAEAAAEEAEVALSTAQNDLADLRAGADSDELAAAKEDVAEKEQQLADLVAGTAELDLQVQQITVQGRQDALNDALEEYANYTVRAPISGTVANFSAYRGQSVSSGTSVATIIADRLTALVSLNEVDVAKVKVGNKVNLTFDAIEDLTITGEVAEIDSIGTVSSSVVNYGVLITFDTQDERVLSGMSVSVVITTAIEQDVLVVSSNVIKTQGDLQYVEVLDDAILSDISTQGITSQNLPRQVTVETGLFNDTETQIVSGLNEGDLIITKTITDSSLSSAKSVTSSTSAGSLLGGGSGGPPGSFSR